MIVRADPLLHLGYCTNIHPAETWDEVLAHFTTHVPAVKAKVCPERPFGVGLRLSALAARRLAEPEVLGAFRELLEARGLYVFTINGFPYGDFHAAAAVKERVYRPDWLEEDRLAYSDQLAGILAALLPHGGEGSVSTVPGCFRDRGTLAEVGPRLAERLLRHAATLVELRERSGRTVTLALEPEPHCVLETTADAVTFFEEHLLTPSVLTRFAGLAGLGAGIAEEALRRHLGVCLDACHAAVEFEDPSQAVERLQRAGIRILKIQVSAGLRVMPPDGAALTALEDFAEGTYLHQVVARSGKHLKRIVDLPRALAEASREDPGDEWRIHFHVPLFHERLGPFQSTRGFTAALLGLAARRPITQELEIETYTWDVLPPEHRRETVVESLCREIAWTQDVLQGAWVA